MIVVSSSFPVGKLAVNRIPVFILSGGRYASAIVLMAPLLVIFRKSFFQVKRRHFLLLILQAFFGVWIFNIFLFWGLKYIPSTNSGIILGTVPTMVVILSRIFYREPLTLRKVVGLVLAFTAVWLINQPGNTAAGTTGSNYWLGILFVMIAAIGEALFLFISKTTSTYVNPYVSASLITIFGFFMIIPLSIWEAQSVVLSQFDYRDVLLMVYFGLVVTFLGYVLWFRGVSAVPAGISAYFTSVMPISAVFLSGLILGETIRLIHYIALILIVSAILTCIYQPGNRESKK